MTEYRAVLFDFGGVISTAPGAGMRAYCEAVGVPWDTLRYVIAGEQSAWSRYELNLLSQEQFEREFEREAAALGHIVQGAAFLDAFHAGMSLRPEMIAVVRALRARADLRVACITNNLSDSAERNPLYGELFELVVESAKVGVRKPDPRIYRIACDLLQVQPAEAIFLDDLGVNLKGARALGMATIKVDESTSAIDELEALLGFALPRPSPSVP